MEDLSSHSNLAHLFLVILSSLLLFAIRMYTSINPGRSFSCEKYYFVSIFIKFLTLFALYCYHLYRGNISLAKLMFRMFTQFHNFMEVHSNPKIRCGLLCVDVDFSSLKWLYRSRYRPFTLFWLCSNYTNRMLNIINLGWWHILFMSTNCVFLWQHLLHDACFSCSCCEHWKCTIPSYASFLSSSCPRFLLGHCLEFDFQ